MIEEAGSGPGSCEGGVPGLVGKFGSGVDGEGDEVERRQGGRQMLFAMAEIVLKVVSFCFQSVECLVLDFPAGPACAGKI